MREKQIEILARGVYVHNGKLLVCHNRKKNNYFLPGGHIEFGESGAYALKREIKEEMGLPCSIGAFLGVVEHTFRYRGERTCELNLVYEMKFNNLVSTKPAPSKEKKLEFIWMPLRQVARSKIEPAVVRKSLVQWLKSSKPILLTAPALKKG
jgi:8-oxo-dGTP diphosphatase